MDRSDVCGTSVSYPFAQILYYGWNMLYALIYIDTTHRIRVFTEGGYNLEKNVSGIGWCLEADATAWPQEKSAFLEMAKLCNRHADQYPNGRIETGPEDYDATYDFPVID